MNSLIKTNILISFPLGAHFHQNIEDYVYRQILNMIHKLSCIHIDGKCNQCHLCDKCQYYKITGENFRGYPGITIKKDIFKKQIFRENEECDFEFYLIGDCKVFQSYIEVFFEDYLKHYLCGFYFQIKSIENKKINNHKILKSHFHIVSVVENDTFQNIYNNMFNYYNNKYQCRYSLLNNDIDIKQIKFSKMNQIIFKTKRIFPQGIIGKINCNEELNEIIFLIGIGKYNFIGGGQIENKN